MPDRIIRRLNGARGSALLAAAVIALVHAATYFDPVQRRIISTGLRLLDEGLPLTIPAFLWLVACVVAFVGAFRTRAGRQRDHFDAWGFGGVAGLLMLWGSSYLMAWVLESWPVDRLVFGVLYLSVALLVASAARLSNSAELTHRRWRRIVRRADAW